MALRADVKCFLLVAPLAGLVVYLNANLASLIRVILSIIFYGMIGALVYSLVILPLLKKFIEMMKRRERANEVSLSENEVMERRETARESQQSRWSRDAGEYEVRVTRPREETRRRRVEKGMKYAVKMFPGEGEELGDAATQSNKNDEQPPSDEDSDDTNHSDTAESDTHKNMTISIGFRLPTGSTVQKKFKKTSSCMTVKRFIEKLGYPLTQFQIVTSFKRKVLDLDIDGSLEDAGLLTNSILVIEESDGLE